VAADLGVNLATVRTLRSRFAVHRLAALADEPRRGRRKPDLVLTEAERAELTRWARRAKTAQFDQDGRRDPQLPRRLPNHNQPTDLRNLKQT
jgi:hypothetical protein